MIRELEKGNTSLCRFDIAGYICGAPAVVVADGISTCKKHLDYYMSIKGMQVVERWAERHLESKGALA